MTQCKVLPLKHKDLSASIQNSLGKKLDGMADACNPSTRRVETCRSLVFTGHSVSYLEISGPVRDWLKKWKDDCT